VPKEFNGKLIPDRRRASAEDRKRRGSTILKA
jgi:hypothetical protein